MPATPDSLLFGCRLVAPGPVQGTSLILNVSTEARPDKVIGTKILRPEPIADEAFKREARCQELRAAHAPTRVRLGGPGFLEQCIERVCSQLALQVNSTSSRFAFALHPLRCRIDMIQCFSSCCSCRIPQFAPSRPSCLSANAADGKSHAYFVSSSWASRIV